MDVREPSTARGGTEKKKWFFYGIVFIFFNFFNFPNKKNPEIEDVHVCSIGGSNCHSSDLKGTHYATTPARYLVYLSHDKCSCSTLSKMAPASLHTKPSKHGWARLDTLPAHEFFLFFFLPFVLHQRILQQVCWYCPHHVHCFLYLKQAINNTRDAMKQKVPCW